MKTRITTIGLLGLMLLVLSAFIFETKAIDKEENEPDYCLTISGKVLNPEKNLQKKILVYLIKSNAIIDSVKTDANTVFFFQLKKNQEYAIKIVEQGFASRLISIATYLPKKIKNNSLFQFHFDLIPFKSSFKLSQNSDILNFPIALIYFNPQKNGFDYNRKYTSHIKNKYKQLLINFEK
jgi:hypothetical protein